MKKALFTVDYTGLFFGVKRRYFETFAEAKEFAKGDYRDNPVTRVYSAEKAEELLLLQKAEDNCNKIW